MTASQVSPASSPSRITSAWVQKVAANSGSNWEPARCLCQSDRSSDATDAVGHLGELSDLGQSRRDGDGIAPKVPGPALAVPLLIGCTDCFLHRLGQTELLGKPARQGRMLGDHVAHVAMTRDGELDADAEAMQRWVPAAQQPHHGQGPTQAPARVVLVGLERDVVAEPLGLLVRVGMTAHVDHEGGVVDDGSLVLAQPERFGEAQRDHRLAQHVLHGLAEPEIDPQ